METILFIISILILFFLIRKAVITILTNYLCKIENRSKLGLKNQNTSDDKVIIRGSLVSGKKQSENVSSKQNLCEKYNKGVVRLSNGRFVKK